jgi:dTDP-4-dehydrorhamnose 3,5-epimerase-like enzyme
MKLIDGGIFQDERGTLRFVNDFNFSDVKRFYQIENSSFDIVRAWQGHKVENKYFFVTSGSFIVCCVNINDWDNPSPDLPVEKIVLTANDSSILMIPAGYANGFKALEGGSKLIVFSSNTLEEANDDDYRFDADMWVNWEEVVSQSNSVENTK